MDAPHPIVVERVTKVYTMGDVEVHALRGVSITVETGTFTAIMGASGSGKSTLMNILGCLDRPTSGRYLLDGRDVSGLDANALAEVRSKSLGFVFQNFSLLSRTSAVENVELPLMYAGVSGRERRAAAQRSLERVGLGERADHKPNQLSGGQQQRVAIARALVNNPRILLADEPTGALDSRTSVEIMALIQELGRSGITVVLVTHESDIAAYASRVVVVKDGEILTDKRQEALIARPDAASAPPPEIPGAANGGAPEQP
jgi:putative ABC transport system ATP-binding protein